MQFSELITELQNRLSINVSNTFWTLDMLKSWLNEANRYCCLFRHWPFTEKALYTFSRADAFYYDFPKEFRSDSIRRLEVEQDDGQMKAYKKIRYEDFMNYIENEPNGTDKIFSDHQRFYFINPKISVSGKQICIWGQEKPAELVNDNDETPFAQGDEAGEEAIIKRALMIALQKARKYKEAAVEREEANIILEQIWQRISEEQSLYQNKDAPFFDVPRFF